MIFHSSRYSVFSERVNPKSMCVQDPIVLDDEMGGVLQDFQTIINTISPPLPIHTASTHELTLNSHYFPSWFEQDTNGMLLDLNGSSAIQAALRSQQAAELLRELSKKSC